MSTAELFHRVIEKCLKVSARGRLEGWEKYCSGGPVPSLPGLAENLELSCPTLRTKILADASAIMTGPFTALGQSWPIDALQANQLNKMWTFDPVTGGTWAGAKHYTFDIPYRHRNDLGDIKYVWEFNRLQFLQPLAAAWRLTREPQYAETIVRVVEQWYEANPPFRGLAWNSGIELALRAISLLVVTTLAGDALPETTVRRLRAMLTAHAFWIARYPSKFSSANNHLVAEAAAEFLIGTAMPEKPALAQLQMRGRETLEREVLLQIFPDGAPAEQSPTYGAFIAEFMLLSAMVGAASGEPFSAASLDRLGAFARFAAAISGKGITVPAIGDDDESKVLYSRKGETEYVLEVTAAIAAFRREAAPIKLPEGGLRLALLGSPGFRPGVIKSHYPALQVFPSGGLSVGIGRTTGGTSWHAVMDHGPLGYLSIAAHGHADALSFTLSVDGTPVLIDPGTYLYHSGGAWRDWFRGTAAHNTCNLNGKDQSKMAGAFNWAGKARAQLLEYGTIDGTWWLEAEHDGYAVDGVLHRRRFFATAGGLQIEDQIVAKGDEPTRHAEVELVFQCAPGIDVHVQGLEARLSQTGKVLLTITLPQGGEINLRSGQNGLSGGWISPRFGELVPAPRLSWRRYMASGSFKTFLAPA